MDPTLIDAAKAAAEQTAGDVARAGTGHALLLAFVLSAVGASIEIGKALQATPLPPFRVVIGRALITGALTMGAGAVLLAVPGIPPLALLGVAAILGTLGTAGLERVFVAVLKRIEG